MPAGIVPIIHTPVTVLKVPWETVKTPLGRMLGSRLSIPTTPVASNTPPSSLMSILKVTISPTLTEDGLTDLLTSTSTIGIMKLALSSLFDMFGSI